MRKVRSSVARFVFGLLALSQGSTWLGEGALAAAEQSLTLEAQGDAAIRRGTGLNDANFGQLPTLEVRQNARSLVRFDLAPLTAALGPEAQLLTAALELEATSVSGFPAAGVEVRAHRVLTDWTELGTTWTCPIDTDLTDTNRDCTTAWNGGDYSAQPTAAVLHTNATLGRVAWNVLPDVEAFRIGTANLGWLLRLRQENLTTAAIYGSREGNGAQAPRLVLTWDSDAVPPVATWVAPANFWVLGQARPLIELTLADGGSGVDPTSFVLRLDGVDISTSCVVSAETARCAPSSDLAEGEHRLEATVEDLDGNVTTVTRDFDLLLTPGPHVREMGALADATIRADFPTRRDGTSDRLLLRESGEHRAIVRFDLAPLQQLQGLTAVQIEEALLRLQVTQARNLGTAGRDVQVFRLQRAWDEVEATWACPVDESPGGQTQCINPWNGGSPAPELVGIRRLQTDELGSRDWTVTAGVQAWLSGPQAPVPNHGWVLDLTKPGGGEPTNPQVRFDARENASGNGPKLRVAFRVPGLADATPPTLAFTAPTDPLPVGDTSPTIALSYSDSGAGIALATLRVFVDGTEITASCTSDLSAASCEPPELAAGPHTATAQIDDLAGNRATASRTFTVISGPTDTTPPTLTIVAPADPVPPGELSPTVSLTYSDAGSGVDVATLRVFVDGAEITASCTIGPNAASCEPPELTLGAHVVTAQLDDLAGNRATANRGFTLRAPDTTPPAIAITSPVGLIINDSRPPIVIDFSDAESGINRASLRVQVNGLDLSSTCIATVGGVSCPPPQLASSTHTITASVRDQAGNRSTVNGSFEVVLDTLPPIVAFTAPAGTLVVAPNAPTITVALSDADSRIDPASFVLRVDGAAATASCTLASGVATCTPSLSEGPHTLEASVADVAGNSASASAAFTLNLDAVAPALSLAAVPSPLFVNQPLVTVVASFVDADAGVDLASFALSLDGAAAGDGCTVSVTGASCEVGVTAGSRTVTAAVRDAAGNLATASVTFEVILDTVAPTVAVVEPTLPQIVGNLSPVLSAAFADAGSGVAPAGVSVRVDGNEIVGSCIVAAGTVQCQPTLAEGQHEVVFEVTDVAGNRGAARRPFELAAADTTPPTLAITTPVDPIVIGDRTPAITLEYSDVLSAIAPATLRVSVDATDISASCVAGTTGAVCEPPALVAGPHTVTAAIEDTLGNRAFANRAFTLELALDVAITAPVQGTLTGATTVDLAGTVDAMAETVEARGIAGTVEGDGTFTIPDVPLVEGSNTITVLARNAAGGIGSATVSVVLDTVRPQVVISTPPDGFVTTSQLIMVTGETNDPGSSNAAAVELPVEVGGLPAEAKNGAFIVDQLLLQPGENTIEARATDAVGNVGSTSIRVTYLPGAAQKLEEMAGNGQRGAVAEELDNPLVVRLTDLIGNPLPGRTVTFDVIRGDGTLRSTGGDGATVTTVSDELGFAQAFFRLGTRAGEGNHEVRVSSAGFPGGVVFCASGTAREPQRVVRIVGNNQTGAQTWIAGTTLPKPLLVQVFDAYGNPVPGAPVTFGVVVGGGSFDGQPTSTMTTDADGKAAMAFTLGPEIGIDAHVVSVNVGSQTTGGALFTITGTATGAEEETRVSGIVLDNQDQPVPTVRVSIDGTPLFADTDAEGRFTIPGAPVGTIHLTVDGRTTTLPGTWPILGFEFNTIPGENNSVGMPIRLLPIDVDSGQIVGGDTDVVLPISGIPGGTLTVFANSVTFPNGDRTGRVSITQVHGDKVPMIAPMGSSFMLAWTIQPPNTRFDPPARISIPNMGEEPGSVVDIFSFDHDLGEFVSAGTAQVTEDGASVVSRPGFGVSKSGWGGCVPPPPPPTDACNDSACTVCENGVPVPRCSECESCNSGTCEPKEVESVTATANGEEERAIVGKEREVNFEAEAEANCELSYEWDFGDGETSEEASPTHEYAEVGDYTVTVTVSCQDCPDGGTQEDTVEVKVIEIDLELDELPEEDEPAPNEEDPGTFLVVNEDDDNENDEPDVDESGSVSGENELVQLKINIEEGLDQGKLRLEAESGGDAIKVWEQETKGTEVELPKTWDFEAGEQPPETLWVEGAGSSGAALGVELKLSYENGDQEPIEDLAYATVIDLEFKLRPDEEDFNVPVDDAEEAVVASVFYKSFDNPDEEEAVEDGAQVMFQLVDGSASLEDASVATDKGLAPAGLNLPTQLGNSATVSATLERFRIDIPEMTEDLEVDFKVKSKALQTTEGVPATAALSANRGTIAADLNDTVSLSVVIRDAVGNLVEDGTDVTWEVDESSAGFVSMQETTVGGTATAVLAAPNEPGPVVVTVSSGAAQASTTITATRVTGSVSSGTTQIDLDSNGSTTVTANFSATDGTPVFWTTSNGTITGSSVVVGGTATATLSSAGGVPGVVVVTANAGGRMVVWQGEFVSTANPVRVSRRFLVGGSGQDGFIAVTRADGSVINVPTYGSSTVTVTGTPGSVVTVAVGGAQPGEAFTFESVNGAQVPGVFGQYDLNLGGATLDATVAHFGTRSLRLDGSGTANIADRPELDFDEGFRVGLWVRPTTLGNATLIDKGTAWGLSLLADGRVQGRVLTSTGPVELTSTGALTVGEWGYVELAVADGDLLLTVGSQRETAIAAGTLVANTSPVTLGQGFDGHLDDLRIDPSAGGNALAGFEGLDGAGQVTIGANGTATFTVRANGGFATAPLSLIQKDFTPGQTGSRTVSFGVFLTSSRDRSKTADGAPLHRELSAYALGFKGGAQGQGQVQVNDPGFWGTIWDVVQSFFGGDPTTTAGTVANIAGGILIVGDIGAIAKNLWRMAFNPDAVNWPELILTSIGLLTEFAPGVGEILDVPISAARALVARFGDSPLARVWVKRFLDVIKRGGGLTPDEATLFRAFRDNPNLADSLRGFIKNEDTWKQFARARARFCTAASVTGPSGGEAAGAERETGDRGSEDAAADDADPELAPAEALAEPSATKACLVLDGFLRDVATRIGPDGAAKVTKVLYEISDDAVARLSAQGDAAFGRALEGMAKMLKQTGPNGVPLVDANTMRRVVNNTAVVSDAYPVTKMLEDIGKVAGVPGADKLVKQLKPVTAQAKGYRYELEAAVFLQNRGGLEILGKGVKVAAGKTDIDVVANGIYYQVKRSRAALGSKADVEKWVGRVTEALGGPPIPAGRIKYVVPDLGEVSPAIRKFMEDVGIWPPEVIPHAP